MFKTIYSLPPALHSHLQSRAWINADHSVIRIDSNDAVPHFFSVNKLRSSHRHKRCSPPTDFVPSDNVWVDATASDCLWPATNRVTLRTSNLHVPPNTFERWCREHVRWRVEPSYVRHHLHSSRCIISVDGSFFPYRPRHMSAA